MAESTLVDSLREEGRQLIDDLVLHAVPLAAAWWAKVIPEDDLIRDLRDWEFFLASPLVDQQGSKVLYEKVSDFRRRANGSDGSFTRISPSALNAVGVDDPIASDVFKIIGRYGGKPPIYLGRCRLGNIEAEELLIVYVSSLPAPWQKVVLKAPAEVDEPLSPRRAKP